LDRDLLPGVPRRRIWGSQENREAVFNEFLRINELRPDVVIVPDVDVRQFVFKTEEAAQWLQSRIE
jgi:hypothetical protein